MFKSKTIQYAIPIEMSNINFPNNSRLDCRTSFFFFFRILISNSRLATKVVKENTPFNSTVLTVDIIY